jgi:hypothetical protein
MGPSVRWVPHTAAFLIAVKVIAGEERSATTASVSEATAASVSESVSV